MSTKQKIVRGYINLGGWHTNRKIVVIESDDWGSIRIPSKEAYNNLLEKGIRVDKCHYCTNDSLASEDDLSLLFDLLSNIKDKNGNPAIITANALVANPDFAKIEESGFSHYYFKKITESFNEYKGCENSLSLWTQGQDANCFKIQSHGREHLNVKRWLYCLNSPNYTETKIAFQNGVYGISTNITSENRKSFLPAFDYDSCEDELFVNHIAEEGLLLFRDIFGFESKSFIAPNYVWGKSLENTLYKNGIRYLQGSQTHSFVNTDNKRIRYLGKTNDNSLIDLARNVHFEPSEFKNIDFVSSCLKDVGFAFRWRKPAIISSHRVNYVGTLNKKNRDNGLKLLKKLLIEIKKQWPDVEFMSSDQLGNLITMNNEH